MMADSVRVTRRPVGAEQSSENYNLMRMALVVVAALAILVSLPAWLRGLEESPSLFGALHHATPPEVAAASATSASNPLAVSHEMVRHQALANALAKRYRVSREAVERFIGLAYAAGQMTKVDPLLIVAVMAVESSFNPIAESVMGAKGLMQIIPEYHQDKLRTTQGVQLNVLDPETNILAGAKVLREYATRTGEDLTAALRLYGGTGPDPENSYTNRVLSERQRLEQLLRRIPERNARQVLPAGRSNT